MLIFIEGPDGSGKTTLCNELINCGAANILISVSRGTKNQSDFYYDIGRSNHKIVFDRCFISDLAYRLWDNGKVGDLSLDEMLYILTNKDCRLIFCHSDTAFDDAMTRGESFITTKKNHDLITNNYDVIQKLFGKFTKVPVMIYDRKFNDVSDVIEFIEKGGN